MPGIFNVRDFPAAGGLMSYGASPTDGIASLATMSVGFSRREVRDLPVEESDESRTR